MLPSFVGLLACLRTQKLSLVHYSHNLCILTCLGLDVKHLTTLRLLELHIDLYYFFPSGVWQQPGHVLGRLQVAVLLICAGCSIHTNSLWCFASKNFCCTTYVYLGRLWLSPKYIISEYFFK